MRECRRGETDVINGGIQRQRDLSSRVLASSLWPISDVPQWMTILHSAVEFSAVTELNSQAGLKARVTIEMKKFIQNSEKRKGFCKASFFCFVLFLHLFFNENKTFGERPMKKSL